MALPELDLNLSTIVDEKLRTKPVNLEDMQEAIEAYKAYAEKLESSEDAEIEKANVYDAIGFYSRTILALEDSEAFFKKSFELFKKHKKVSKAQMTKLKLATTLAWLGNYNKSDEYFKEAYEKFNEVKGAKSQTLLSYVLDHWARSKYERGMLKEAMDLLLSALELKVNLGQMDELSQIESCIQVVRSELLKTDPDFEKEFEAGQ